MSPSTFRSALLWLALGLAFSHVLCKPADGDRYEDDYNNDDPPEEEEPDEEINDIRSTPANFSRNPNENVELPCELSSPEAVTQWRHNGVAVWLGDTKQNRDGSLHRYDNNSLFIKQLQLSHAGNWSCQIIQEKPNDFEIVHYVSVSQPAKIVRMVPPERKVQLKSGIPVTFACYAKGDPQPEITWEIPDLAKNDLKIGKNSITIDKVSGNHAGTYVCTANNSMGSDSSKKSVEVLYAPIVTVEKETVNSAKDFPTQLACTAHAYPAAQVSWFKGDKPVRSHHVTLAQEGATHYLKISSTKMNDFGDYTCVANNTEGTTNKTITLTANPVMPIIENVVTTDDGWTELTWVIQSQAPIKEYEIIYKKQEEDSWNTTQLNLSEMPGSDNTYKVIHKFQGLDEGQYHARIKARNEYGWSTLSEQQLFSGRPVPGNGAMQLRISLWTSVVLILTYLCH